MVPMLVKTVDHGDQASAILEVGVVAGIGLAFAIIWRHELTGLIANPIGNLFDGGNTAPDPKPLYSIAEAKRKRGRYNEALMEIHGQLERFPGDFQGQLMMAEIQAENLRDLNAAETTIQRICNQRGQSGVNIAVALNALADWQLKLIRDRDAARQTLEKIGELLPDSEFSALAAQRIAHLATAEQLGMGDEPIRFTVKAGIENMGLLSAEQQMKAPEEDLSKQVADYVVHLAEHPLDTDAREKLAVLYAKHYGRLDLAAEQLEQLIGHPNQPASRVVHWLNLLADLQVEHGGSIEIVQGTVNRISSLFPNSAMATAAQNRIARLKLEFRKREKSQTIRLGSYEQDIGLKKP
jgi:tetratricopeptide (TPR) repeat protein